MKRRLTVIVTSISAVAVFVFVTTTPCFSENDHHKKNKHKDEYSKHIEKEIRHEMKKDKDDFRYEKENKQDKVKKYSQHNAMETPHVFSIHERDAILKYYRMKNQSLPPGLAKKNPDIVNLPPGWQKKMVRGQVVSSDIYRYAEPVPDDVIMHLPQPPAQGTSLIKIDNRIVRVVDATKTIIDVIDVK